ncbi:MAG: hypothetical protein D4R73_09420 [Deltaproteobacteria bacterium]|nr:MAG: hypothetical protein D4R73_09420 [Deltaproteobacteria bacterium]
MANPKGNPNFKKGVSGNPAGKPPGTPNKLTKDMTAQTWRVFEALEADEKLNLLEVAKKNPMWFHSVFSSRIIPKDVNVRVIESFDDLTDEEKENILRNWEEKNRAKIEGGG